jgi:diguanylate cyclase (GGDEF)-like protein
VSRATGLYKINRELRQTNQRLNTIVESTRRVFSGVDEEKVLMEILQTTARYTGAAPTIIFIQRRDGLIPKMAMGVPPERLTHKPIAISPSVWQEAQAFSTSLGEPDIEKMFVKLLGQEDFFLLPLGSGIKAHTLVVIGATPDSVDRAALRSYAPIASLAIRHARKMRELRAQAEHDSLTGLLNHAAFQRYLRLEVKRHQRMERPLGLVMLDIDHFKSVNDSHGHPAGDRALRLLAETLRKNSRETDMLARYGGEEFVLVLSDTDRKGAEAKMQEILQQVRATDWGDAGPLTLSAGIAMFPIDGKGPASLIEAADRALYAAKHGGRDRAITYAEWLEETLSRDNDSSDAGVNIDRP